MTRAQSLMWTASISVLRMCLANCPIIATVAFVPLWLPQWRAFIRESEWEQVCGNPGLTTHKTDQLTWIANHWQTHSNMKLRSIKEKIAIFLAILKNIKSINHRSRLIFFFAISLFICNIHTEYSYKLFLSNELFHPSHLYLLLLHWSQWNP